MSGDTLQNWKAQFASTSLFVKHVKILPGVCFVHGEALLTSNAKYPIQPVGVKMFNISARSLVWNRENLFVAQLLKQLAIGFVENTSFGSGYEPNPFSFKHYDVNFIALYSM